MASLRKRPADAATTEPEVAIEADATAAPTPDHASEALKQQIEALSQAQTMEQQAAIAQLAATERRHAWLESTPGAKENRDALGRFHHEALQAGLVDTSPEYFRFMEDQLAALQAPHPATHIADEMQQARQDASEPPPTPPRPPMVSAPVSRSIPNGSGRRHTPGKITLTAAEVDAARTAGVSVEEYAKQKIRLAEMRASGQYGEDRR
jgi:phage I-like protein